jgi:hypothetical protein
VDFQEQFCEIISPTLAISPVCIVQAEHDESVAKYQKQLKQARQVIEELEADKALALASFKQDFHSTLEGKDEELSSVRVKAKLYEAENETLKRNLSELQISSL